MVVFHYFLIQLHLYFLSALARDKFRIQPDRVREREIFNFRETADDNKRLIDYVPCGTCGYMRVENTVNLVDWIMSSN